MADELELLVKSEPPVGAPGNGPKSQDNSHEPKIKSGSSMDDLEAEVKSVISNSELYIRSKFKKMGPIFQVEAEKPAPKGIMDSTPKIIQLDDFELPGKTEISMDVPKDKAEQSLAKSANKMETADNIEFQIESVTSRDDSKITEEKPAPQDILEKVMDGPDSIFPGTTAHSSEIFIKSKYGKKTPKFQVVAEKQASHITANKTADNIEFQVKSVTPIDDSKLTAKNPDQVELTASKVAVEKPALQETTARPEAQINSIFPGATALSSELFIKSRYGKKSQNATKQTSEETITKMRNKPETAENIETQSKPVSPVGVTKVTSEKLAPQDAMPDSQINLEIEPKIPDQLKSMTPIDVAMTAAEKPALQDTLGKTTATLEAFRDQIGTTSNSSELFIKSKYSKKFPTTQVAAKKSTLRTPVNHGFENKSNNNMNGPSRQVSAKEPAKSPDRDFQIEAPKYQFKSGTQDNGPKTHAKSGATEANSMSALLCQLNLDSQNICPRPLAFRKSEMNHEPFERRQTTRSIGPGTVKSNPDEQLSRSLFYALKNPEKLGLRANNNFINLAAILSHPTLDGKKYQFADVERLIANRADQNFGRFELLKRDAFDRGAWSIGLTNVRRFHQVESISNNDPMHRALFESLDNAQVLGLTKSETDFINCADLLQITEIKQINIELEDIERILSNANDPLYNKYIFVRYESGLCQIKKNAYFTLGTHKVKVKYTDQSYSDRDLAIAKAMAFNLRHNVNMTGMTDEGFVELDVLLKQPSIKKHGSSIEDVKRILSLEEYPRYALIEIEPNRYIIKSTHGHSIPRIMAWNWANWKLETKLPVLIHRCNYPSWAKIRKNGFEDEKHATVNFLHPDDIDRRKTREIEISIDAEAARRDSVKFFVVPENQLIITEGLAGCFSLKYFMKAVDLASGEIIKIR